MANTNIPKISARFETTLASSMAKGASTFNLTSGTDKAGNALSGIYGFVIDNGSSTEEFVIGSVSGTVVSSVTTGLDPTNPQTTVVALQQSHRKGASVKITDYPILGYLREALNGNTNFPLDNPLNYTVHPTFTTRTQIIDKGYADDIIAGTTPSASTTTAGTVKISTASGTPTAVETGDPRVPTSSQTTALAGNNTSIAVGAGNKFVTQTGLQNGAEIYAASTGSANAYILTLAPVPTALAAGQKVTMKANFANTGSATLNVNGLGAATIKKIDGATNLVSGDIASGQIVELEYDGTNFQMLSPVGNAPIPALSFKPFTFTRTGNAASGAVVQAHGLGVTPKYVRASAKKTINATTSISLSDGSYNGSSTAVSYVNNDASGNTSGTDTTNIINITENAGSQVATVAFDATNVTFTFTKTGAPSSNVIQVAFDVVG